MFVFGGYIDMRGASDELWQYELGECLYVTDKGFRCIESQSSIYTIPKMLLNPVLAVTLSRNATPEREGLLSRA